MDGVATSEHGRREDELVPVRLTRREWHMVQQRVRTIGDPLADQISSQLDAPTVRYGNVSRSRDDTHDRNESEETW